MFHKFFLFSPEPGTQAGQTLCGDSRTSGVTLILIMASIICFAFWANNIFTIYKVQLLKKTDGPEKERWVLSPDCIMDSDGKLMTGSRCDMFWYK